MSIFQFNINKLKESLSKTRDNLVNRFKDVLVKKTQINDELINSIEEILLTADVGFQTSEYILKEAKRLFKECSEQKDFNELIKEVMYNILTQNNVDNIDKQKLASKPKIILISGVNGVGKTTSIGKLAYKYQKNGQKVLIASADTFRAGATEQLDIWAQRAEVEIIKMDLGADPAAIVYRAIDKAMTKDFDVILIDTAGRLHTKQPLMSELKKVQDVIFKKLNKSPEEILLVIDSTTGQNALRQIQEFLKYVSLTGIILTKLDGTAKGGIIFPIYYEYKIPVRYIGVGESIEDLQDFDAKIFIESLFSE